MPLVLNSALERRNIDAALFLIREFLCYKQLKFLTKEDLCYQITFLKKRTGAYRKN